MINIFLVFFQFSDGFRFGFSFVAFFQSELMKGIEIQEKYSHWILGDKCHVILMKKIIFKKLWITQHTFLFTKNFPFCESHWTSSLYYVYFLILNVLFLCYYYIARVHCNNLPFEMRVKKINRKEVDKNGVNTPEEEKYRSKNVTHIRWQAKKMYFGNRCNLLNIRTLFIKIACGQMCGEWVNGRRQKIEKLRNPEPNEL